MFPGNSIALPAGMFFLMTLSPPTGTSVCGPDELDRVLYRPEHLGGNLAYWSLRAGER